MKKFKNYVLFVFLFNLTMMFAGIDVVTTLPNQEGPASKHLKAGLQKLSIFAYLLEHMYALYDADSKFKQKYNQEPTICCGMCKKRILTYAELSGVLEGKTFKDAIDGKNTYEEMKHYLDDLIKTVSNDTPLEVTKFMLNVANKIEYKCSVCDNKTWIDFLEAQLTS